MKRIFVIGGGLAGSEAAWQIAERGIQVILYEMRPNRMTPAHKTSLLAELVCSNSLKSKDIYNAHGLLKEELKRLGSLIIRVAEKSAIPGGKALVVDREKFSREITEIIESHPNIRVLREEVKKLNLDEITVVATGPLTSESLSEELKSLTGEEYLFFYDAISPIVEADSLNFEKLYRAERHGWEENAYLNAPLDEEEYYSFLEALREGEIHEPHDFEKNIPYFEGCLPIEVMAKRGVDTLRFGPLRPTGLKDPRTGKEPFAVVQLRPENKEGTLYSLVGFQTQLKIKEQERIFRMIPGLEKARFLRYGAVHRNTFLNSPKLLNSTLQFKKFPNLLVAGQLIGTEGYVEAAMGGLLAGINAFLLSKGESPVTFPEETLSGALIHYVTGADPKFFQPMNANMGLLTGAPQGLNRYERRKFYVDRALKTLGKWIEENFSKIF
jgi:methylenetetrahydrofolate--tRNA-(uracil-5-)-methyltransferase